MEVDGEEEDATRLKRMLTKWHRTTTFTSVEEVKRAGSIRPLRAIEFPKGFAEWAGLGDWLQDDDGLEFLQICPDNHFHKLDGFLESVVCNVEKLLLRGQGNPIFRVDEEVIGALNVAIQVAASSGRLKVKFLAMMNCEVDAKALAESVILHNIEELLINSQPGLCHLTDALRHPKCKLCRLSFYAFFTFLPKTKEEEEQNGIEEQDDYEWLAKALSQRCSLRKLTFSGVGFFPARLMVPGGALCHLEGISLTPWGWDETTSQAAAAAIRSSNLHFLELNFRNDEVPIESTRIILESVRDAPSIKHLVLWSDNPSAGTDEYMELCCELLQSSACRLRSFFWHFFDTSQQEERLGKLQEAIVEAIESNYQSRLKRIEIEKFQSQALQSRCSRVLARNALFWKGRIENAFAPPDIAKLFMCGHTGVGKTTIATNLFRTFTYLPCFQRHPSTQGIKVMPLLHFKNQKKLLIHDLAGQEAYHAFHHYFVRGSERNLFLIVCKLKLRAEAGARELERYLQYWLRFIVSHQSASPRRKPRVFIVFNNFLRKTQDLGYDDTLAAQQIFSRYDSKLQLQGPYRVNALKPAQLRHLKAELQTTLDSLLDGVLNIPWTCRYLISQSQPKRSWFRTATKQTPFTKRVVEIRELLKLMTGGGANDDGNETTARESALKFTLMCLHDMGEAIHFANPGLEDTTATLLSNHAVLDVQWFLQDLIGVIIPQLKRQINEPAQEVGENITSAFIVHKLKKVLVNQDVTAFNVVLNFFHEMGLLIPHDNMWQGNWSQALPKLMVVPALLTGMKLPRFQYIQDDCVWGRRLQCADKDFTLFPSGVFGLVQMEVSKFCKQLDNNSSKLGEGWICFEEDLVKVLVKIGGNMNHWTDRQWVDVLLMGPRDAVRCSKAEEILNKMRDCVSNMCLACPFLKMEELVINPVQVNVMISSKSTTEVIEAEQVMCRPLNYILRKAKIDGLKYSETWIAGEMRSSLWELLMPSELKKLLSPRKRLVVEYNMHVAAIYNLSQASVSIPKFENHDMQMMAEFLLELNEATTKNMKLAMEHMMDTLHRIEDSLQVCEQSIKQSCSKILQAVKVKCPKHPYIMAEGNMFFKYLPVVGTAARVHYMCEFPEEFHLVDHEKYRGVSITLAHEWFRKYQNVLVPALSICFLIAKLGVGASCGAAGGGGRAILTGLVDAAQGSLSKMLADVQGGLVDWRYSDSGTIAQPSAADIEEVFEFVKKQAGQNDNVIMRKHFGLQFDSGYTAWLCKEHHPNYAS